MRPGWRRDRWGGFAAPMWRADSRWRRLHRRYSASASIRAPWARPCFHQCKDRSNARSAAASSRFAGWGRRHRKGIRKVVAFSTMGCSLILQFRPRAGGLALLIGSPCGSSIGSPIERGAVVLIKAAVKRFVCGRCLRQHLTHAVHAALGIDGRLSAAHVGADPARMQRDAGRAPGL
jgi:hypothetical protein